MSDEGKIKLAQRPPTYCSSCFGQHPQERHIDFGSYWDGPVVQPRDTITGTEQVQIDDLVICENCIKRAAAVLGLVNAPDLVEENRTLAAKLRRTLQRNSDLARAARRLNDALAITLANKQARSEELADAQRARNKAEREIESGVDPDAPAEEPADLAAV